MNVKGLKKSIKRCWPLFLMALPGLAYFVINNYLPMAGLAVAFKNYNFQSGIWGSKFIGFENFRFLFRTKDAFIITRNTILYNAGFIVIHTVFAVTAAIILNEIRHKAAARLYQTIILLPYLISMIIVSYLAFSFLSTDQGFIDKTLIPLFGGRSVNWYAETKYWPFILNIVSLWKGFGFYAVIYLSAVVGIDRSYYEAAELDGANKLQEVFNITIPHITPVISVMVLLAIGRIFYSDFGLFYRVPMNSGPLFSVTNVIDTYVYRGLIVLGDIGMTAAAGLYQAAVGFILVFTTNLVVRRVNPENALF
ncbi:MAG: ABC transporter permease subunit [Treponema sp.]|jgi:putative aldouronate transport system permease protein|nr:ABC transporter permease subunit [Treponema sp.]